MTCNCKLLDGNRIGGLPDGLRPRLLAGLAKADLDSLLSGARHRRFRAGSIILHQEDPAEHFSLLTSGQGRQFVMTDKEKKVFVYWLTAGQTFGGASLVANPFHYLASTELVTDSCAWVWNRGTIRTFMPHCPQLLDNILSIAVTERVVWLLASQASLGSEDARGRIASLLVSLASGIGRPTADGIELKITNEDLSAGANVTPFTVSRVLSDWQRAGVLVRSRGKILLRNPLLLASD